MRGCESQPIAPEGRARHVIQCWIMETSEGTVLTFSEVYRRADGEWRIVHTHWSFAQSSDAA